MTSVLVESFFVDNATDKKIGDTLAEQKAFGIAYAQAILEYLGVAYKKETTPTFDNTFYRVQVGAYKDKTNAEKVLNKLKKAGFEAIVVKE